MRSQPNSNPDNLDKGTDPVGNTKITSSMK